MAQVAATAGVYPTTERVGGDDYGVHTEANLATLIGSLTGHNYVISGLTASAAGLVVTVATGAAFISGHHALVTAPVAVTLPDNATTYLYLRLLRDGLGNVASAVVETGGDVAPADSALLASGVASAGAVTLTDRRIFRDGHGSGVNADKLDDVELSAIPGATNTLNRFQVSGSLNEQTIAGGAIAPAQAIPCTLANGKSIRFVRLRFQLVDTNLRLRLGFNSALWNSTTYWGELSGATIYTNNTGAPVIENLWVYIVNTAGVPVSCSGGGWWLDISTE